MTAAPVDLLLADRYRLVERIAVGGMGEVWRAQDTRLGRSVAVKTLRAEFVDDPDFRARFRAEARHAGRLAHPGIASVYDFGETAGSAWLVMELVAGEPLSTVLRREGALSVDRTLDLVAQAAAALQAAHDAGVVHRDVKPGNLLVRTDGVLKVTDFGIASATDAVPLTQTGLVVGTAYYLSPEQAAGRSGTPASDLYSLGVVAYECLSGGRPFPGENPVAVALAHLQAPVPPLRPEVPEPVCELVLRALAKDPAERFGSAAELAHRAVALRAALAGPWQEQDEGGLAALPVAPPPATRAATAEPTAPDPVNGAGIGASGAAEARADHGPEEPSARTQLLPAASRTAASRTPGSRARSSRRAVTAVAGLLAVLAVGLGLRATGDAPATDAAGADAGPTASVPAQAEPAQVTLDAAGYLGQPAAAVQAALTELGLVPSLAYDGSDSPVGTVSGVEPSGQLAVGSGVVLHVVPEPPAAEAAPEPAPAAPEPAVQPVPDDAAAEPAAEEPAAEPAAEQPRGKGNKGKGRDKK